MKYLLLGLGLILSVTFLDVRHGFNLAWAFDLPGAEAALQKKDFSKVVSLLSPEVEKLDRKGLFVLAKAYTALKNHEAAIKAYTACMALDPKDFEAKTLIGKEQIASGHEKEALPTLKDAIEINNRYLPAYKLLTEVHEKRKNNYELRILYQDMVEKFGESPEYITKLCELTTIEVLFDLSLKYCQLGIQKNAQEPKNFVYLGITYKDTGDKTKANVNLKKAADDFAKSDLAQLTYAQYLEEQKNFIGSYSYYRRASIADPKSLIALKGIGSSAVEIQKYAEALEAFQKACSMNKSTLPALRKATNSIRTMKITEWLKKFETLVERCGDQGFASMSK